MQELLKKIAFVFAIEGEIPALPDKFAPFTHFSGMGKVNAASKTTEIILKYKPSLIVNFGTSGASSKKLSGLVECGVFSDRDTANLVFIHGETFYQNEALKVVTDETLLHVSTGDNFVQNAVAGCDIVDMEAYAHAAVCRKYGINFKCYKYITDYTNDTSLKDWQSNISSGKSYYLEKMNDILEDAIQSLSIRGVN